MRPGLCRCAVVIALVACGGQQSSQGPGSTTPTSHALAVEVSGNGKVSSSPAGIDCGSTCSATFSQAVTLTATAGSGASFAGWGGACSGTGSCVVPMTADATVKATFQTTAPGMHALRVNLKGSGRVVSTPSGIDCGATCSAQFADGTSVALDVRPDAGWSFSGWSGACSGSQACSITLTSDTSVGAAFQQAPPADVCEGLLPASLPNPVVATLPESGCLGGTSDDGIGNYLLGYSRQLGDPSGHTFPGWQFFTIQDGKAVRIGTDVEAGDQTAKWILSQPSGFTTHESSAYGQGKLSWYSHEGAPGPTYELDPGNSHGLPITAAEVDPSGGLAVVRSSPANGYVTEYQRFDKAGAVESPWVRIDAGPRVVMAVGVALSGHALVLDGRDAAPASPRPVQVRWLDRNGTPLTDWFAVPDLALSGFHFLMDGSLVLREGIGFFRDQYKYRFEDGKAAVSALPDWLQQRSVNHFEVVRLGKGYASWGDAGPCPGKLEVLATSGKSCGCVAVPSLSRLSSIGRDTSLMVTREERVPPAPAVCKYDLYPQLLK